MFELWCYDLRWINYNLNTWSEKRKRMTNEDDFIMWMNRRELPISWYRRWREL